MHKPLPQDIFDNITFIQTCPLCKTAYDQRGIRRVMGKGDTQWLHLTCERCRAALMAVVVMGGGGVSSVGMMTDFSYDDAVRFRDERVITTDDCLALHQFLEYTYDLSIDRQPAHRKSGARARKR
ncbi:MAG: hypothetical protein AAB633_00215 [Patescibacteria group bacterium]